MSRAVIVIEFDWPSDSRPPFDLLTAEWHDAALKQIGTETRPMVVAAVGPIAKAVSRAVRLPAAAGGEP